MRVFVDKTIKSNNGGKIMKKLLLMVIVVMILSATLAFAFENPIH